MHFPFNNKRKHLDCDKVNPGAHDKGSWWIIRLLCLSLLVIRSCALLAGVASISNRVIAPKLERQQNKMKEGRGEGIRGFLFSPSPPFSFLVSLLLSSRHSRRTRAGTLATQASYGYSFFSLSFFYSFSKQFCERVWDATIKPVFDGHSWRIADWPLNTGLTILKVGHWRKNEENEDGI